MIWRDLAGFFFPSECLICSQALQLGEQHLCFTCLGQLPRTFFWNWPQHPIQRPLKDSLPVEAMHNWLFFSEHNSVRPLVHRIKYQGGASLASYLASQAALEMGSGFFGGSPVFIPVPLHPAKWRQRGYNQSLSLAQGLQQVWGGSIEQSALRRLRHTKTQTGMNKEERKKNLSNAMAWNGIGAFAEEASAIVLVDDVLTTGATLGACWEVLPEPLKAKTQVWTLAAAFGA